MKRYLLVLCASLLIHGAWAQESKLDIGFEYRPRLAIDAGYIKPQLVDESTLSYLTQRTRLNLQFKNSQLETYLSLQDVRFWGGDDVYKKSGPLGNSQSLSLHQGWFILKPHKNIAIKTGRQLFAYDDQRVLSSRGWNDYQITYDAILLAYNDTLNKIDVGLTWNSESAKNMLYPDEKFKVFDFIRYQRSFDKLNMSALVLLTGNALNDTVETIYLRGTYGLNAIYKSRGFKLRITAYYQNNINDKGDDISAYCASIFAQQELLSGKISLGMGLDYLSGQNETNTDAYYQKTNHQFDILYGRRHGWYGYMDYFSTLPDQGLADYYLKTKYQVTKTILLQLDYHYFNLATYRYDSETPALKSNRGLGQEFDFTCQWKMFKEATLQAGYSFFMPTNTLEQIKGVQGQSLKFPQFAYLMLVVKPKFTMVQK